MTDSQRVDTHPERRDSAVAAMQRGEFRGYVWIPTERLWRAAVVADADVLPGLSPARVMRLALSYAAYQRTFRPDRAR